MQNDMVWKIIEAGGKVGDMGREVVVEGMAILCQLHHMQNERKNENCEKMRKWKNEKMRAF